MSLSKQLMLLISAIFFAIFAVNFYLSINNIRNYLEIESEVHAQDTATAMGLSLSPYILDKEDTILETMVNTIFDRGYFREILLTDVDGKELVRKTNPETFTEVPAWFVEVLPMKTGSAFSDIDAGWMIGGRIEVSIHPGFGYLKLWTQVKQTLSYSLMLFLLSLAALALVIRMLLAPLHRIRALAERIGEGKYEKIDPLPWTSEIRSVAHSMNLMSGKIERVVSALSERLLEASDRLHTDALTGLATKVSFETRMKEHFIANDKGYLFLIRIDNLTQYASRHSVAQVDGYIRAFANKVSTIAQQSSKQKGTLFRVVGAEFVLVMKSLDKAGAEALCKELCAGFEEIGKTFEVSEVGHMGGVGFDSRSTVPSLLAAANEAFEKSRIIGANEYAISETAADARSIEEWNLLVAEAIANETFSLRYANLSYSLDPSRSEELVLEEAVADVRDNHNSPVPIGTFISIAESTQRAADFDLKVVRRVIDRLRIEQPKQRIAVNLSMYSVRSNGFRQALFSLLNDYKAEAPKLVFSLSAYAAAQDIDAFLSFIDFARRAGSGVMLKRYESRHIDIDKFSGKPFDYIRIARHDTEDIAVSADKQQMVKAIQELGNLLNIEILAEAVASDEDIECLRRIGLAAASRREQ